MGRIEEALQKLQEANRRSKNDRATSQRLAEVIPQEHEYAGRRVVFDVEALERNGLLVTGREERTLAEQYRVLKRPLLRNARPDHVPPVPRGNLLMVASALSGEGKTFTCVNLCLSIARERDWDVVLVDGDCAKPHLTGLFGAEEEPGLIDLLLDPRRSFDSVVMPTDVPGLSFVAAGARNEHASELLASNRMGSIAADLAATPGRMIVFDSSPLLLTTESAALALHVGQVVVVVRANSTPRQAVIDAVGKLDHDKAITSVLNQAFGTGSTLGAYGEYGAYGAGSA